MAKMKVDVESGKAVKVVKANTPLEKKNESKSR
jgi:hypothetical protein